MRVCVIVVVMESTHAVPEFTFEHAASVTVIPVCWQFLLATLQSTSSC